MSERTWVSGDVAMVTGMWTSGGESAAVAIRTPLTWQRLSDGALSVLHSDDRPVVVIDPENTEQVKKLADLVSQTLTDHETYGPITGAVEHALRELADPKPLFDEPKNYLAVVKLADGRRYWRWSAGDAHTGQPWRLLGAVHADTEDDGNWRWFDLDVAEIVSEGVAV